MGEVTIRWSKTVGVLFLAALAGAFESSGALTF
jgi:hypothetical protein